MSDAARRAELVAADERARRLAQQEFARPILLEAGEEVAAHLVRFISSL